MDLITIKNTYKTSFILNFDVVQHENDKGNEICMAKCDNKSLVKVDSTHS